MDENTNQHPPMQGDDELAKALQGGLQFEETPSGQDGPQDGDAPTMSDHPGDSAGPSPTSQPADDEPAGSDGDSTPKIGISKPSGMPNGTLDKLKSSALEELRPLVGKLDLPSEEKFDTLLLIIRSTDDQSLLDEAFDAAKNISDDTKRAQALLDIIKEVDYFSTKR